MGRNSYGELSCSKQGRTAASAPSVPTRRGPFHALISMLLVGALAPLIAGAQEHRASRPQTPARYFGQPLDDIRIPSWKQIVDYHRHLSETTDRVRFEEVARTIEDRPIILATVSSPQNLARIEEIRRIQLRLADPRTLRPGELDSIVAQGRSVLLLYAIEANQTGAWLALLAFIHQLATLQTDEVKGWLDNTVVLFMNVTNPDGEDFTHKWVEKTRGTQWEGTPPPGLSTFYGEANRDWYTYSLRETRAVAEVMRRWQPNAVHDLHTMGFVPRIGVRFFTPPFIGPLEPNIHPLIWHMQGELGMAMAGRMLQNNLSGVTYDTFYDAWNPTMGYFAHHHTMKMLTEASPGRMTARVKIPFEDLRGGRGWPDPHTPSAKFPLVWPGGEWGNKEVIEYSTTALAGEVDHLSAHRERYLRAKYQAASETIARPGPPYAFVIPAAQHDSSSLRDMLEMLQIGEIEVRRATRAFNAGDRQFAAGDYVVRLDQPFGNWAKAMLEPQHFPEQRACPTCPIAAPYDAVGFSYPAAMGVNVVQIDSPLQANFELTHGVSVSGAVTGVARPAAYLLSPNENAAFKAVAQLLRDKVPVSRLRAAADIEGRHWPPGSFVVGARGGVGRLSALANEHGLEFVGVRETPDTEQTRLRLPRVAVYKPHISERNGWAYGRLLFPEYGLPFEFALDADLRRGRLKTRFDTIILPAFVTAHDFKEGYAPGAYPPEMTGGIGAEGLHNLDEFVRAGGALIAVDQANELLIDELKLPVKLTNGNTMGMFGGVSPATANTVDGVEFAVPGSYLRMRTASAEYPLTYGMPREFAGMFNRGQIFEPTGPEAAPFITYPSGDLLVSGMAVGADKVLPGKAAAVDVRRGAGRIVLFGIRPEMRMQTRGTYKLLFNTIFESASL
jgi:hypothetical protein